MKRLKEIIEKLKSLKEEIKNNYKAEVIGVFGSYARNKQNRKSDIDVLVKFYDGATLFELIGIGLFLEKRLGIKRGDVVPYDTVREEIRNRIFKEAVYL